MKPYVIIVIAIAVLFYLVMEILSRPTGQQRAPIISAYRTRKKKPASAPEKVAPVAPANEVATPNEAAPLRLSLRELESNPKQYEGERVAVDDKLMVWAVKSYYELVCGNWPVDSPCTPAGGPRNPRCEYMVQFAFLVPNSAVIYACVPRSKLASLSGAWPGENGVQVIGVVAPNSQPGYVSLRDSVIIQPRENTSEEWPAAHK